MGDGGVGIKSFSHRSRSRWSRYWFIEDQALSSSAVAKDGLATTAAVDVCVAPGNLHAGLSHIQFDGRLFRRGGGDVVDNLLCIHLGCVAHLLSLLWVDSVDTWLGKHDLVEGVEAGFAGDELLRGLPGRR